LRAFWNGWGSKL